MLRPIPVSSPQPDPIDDFDDSFDSSPVASPVKPKKRKVPRSLPSIPWFNSRPPSAAQPEKVQWKETSFSDALEVLGGAALLLGVVFLSTTHPSNPALDTSISISALAANRPGWAYWPSHPLIVSIVSLVVFMLVRKDSSKLKVLSQFLIAFNVAIGLASLWFFYRR